MSNLLDDLRANEKFGSLFNTNAMVDSYKTGIAVLDYMLGYKMNIYNDLNEIVDSRAVLGLQGGCYVMDIGKSSTAKTSLMLFIAAMIVRPFKHSFLLHFDLEQAMTITRAKNMTRFTILEMKSKYVLRQENSTMEEIKKMLMNVYKMKIENPDIYKYDAKKQDEFGNEIIVFQPTVVLIDSIPSLTVEHSESDKKEWKKLEEITSQTERMRLTAEIGRLYTDLLPYLRAANIIVISINHIRVNPQMGIVPSAAELLYLKQDEAMPGGKTPPYLAHYLFKNVAIGSKKYTKEEDGFDGFGIQLMVIKARSNSNGQVITLIFDKVNGISPIRSNIEFAKENGLIGGNKNAMYFINNKDQKFPLRTVESYFSEHPEMYKVMYDHIVPVLETKLGAASDIQEKIDNALLDY